MPNNLRYRKAWRWPDSVERYIAGRAQGFTVHVCNGASDFGDVRIDRHSRTTDIRADLYYLPLADACADTVVSDPPWELQYQFRTRFATEVRRILRPGGLFILAAPWCPKVPRMAIQEVLIPEWQLMAAHNVCPLWLLKKVSAPFWGGWEAVYLQEKAKS